LASGPSEILAANAVTFAASALALMALDFGPAPEQKAGDGDRRPSLLQEARDGLRSIARIPALRPILFASGAGLFFGGVFNVGELLLARNELGTAQAGFSLLVTIYGLGFIAGSLSGARGGTRALLTRRFVLGLVLMAVGFGASGLAPTVAVAALTFGSAGYGNGLVLVYERLLIQELVPDALAGRVFGAKDALSAWAFALAFLLGPALVELLGTRGMLVAAGSGGLAVSLVAAGALTAGGRAAPAEAVTPRGEPQALPGYAGADAAGNWRLGQDRPNLVGSRAHWLALLDDLGEGSDHRGVELSSGVRR
jgi:MFS family permease